MKLLPILVLGIAITTVYTTIDTVPVFFVTEFDIHSKESETNFFLLRLCGGCYYDKKIATVYINLPNRFWSIPLSNYVTVNVTDSSGELIAQNNGSPGDWKETFSFTYSKNYGDLTFNVTTAQATGGLAYTINVQFSDSPTELQSDCKKRYFTTDEEVKNWINFEKKIEEIHSVGKTYKLVSVFKTIGESQVITEDLKEFQFNYCFDHTLLPGSVMISTVATDEISGFGTYGCPGSVRPCQTGTTPFYDPSGASVNFVKVEIKDAKDLEPVQALVVGDGQKAKWNTFTLAASKYFPNKST